MNNPVNNRQPYPVNNRQPYPVNNRQPSQQPTIQLVHPDGTHASRQYPQTAPLTPVARPAPTAAAVASRLSLQSKLTETTFSNFLDGFQEVQARDLLELKGGRVRYVIEDVDAYGNVRSRKYRLGGWLTKVDPMLRYLRLMNPYAKKAWSVQLTPPGQHVRLYYMPPGTSDEIATMRNLLTQMENGTIRITKSRS